MARRRTRMKVNPKDIRPISDEDPLKLFHASIRSPSTDKGYTGKLRLILCDVLEDVLEGTFEQRARQFVELGRNEPKKMMSILLELSEAMSERTKKDKSDSDYMNPSSIPPYFTSVRKLLNSNDIAVNWSRVTLTYPELDNVDDSRGWTLEEIRRMLDHAKDPRNRAIILVLASSGMRVGGMQLRWGDLTPMYDVDGRMVKEGDLEGETPGEVACVAVRVYRSSYAEYVTFITPEAYRALMDYAVQWETKAGRKPRDNDPIFRSRAKPHSMLSESHITSVLIRVSSSAGVRKRHSSNPHKWEVPMLNGFRRFYNKATKNTETGESNLSALIKSEFIMGHSGLTPLDRHYYKADIEEKAKTYVKMVPSLTISESERLKHANGGNDRVLSELNKPDDRISQFEGVSILEGMAEYLRNGVFADSG